MRDLEIRGAGELLGTRPSGHIQAVGFHLYTRLLADAVRQIRRLEGVSKNGQKKDERGKKRDFGLSSFLSFLVGP